MCFPLEALTWLVLSAQLNSDIFKRHGHYNLQRLFRKHFTSDTNDALQSETEDEETDVESEKGEDKEKGCLGRIKELCKPKRPEGDLEQLSSGMDP